MKYKKLPGNASQSCSVGKSEQHFRQPPIPQVRARSVAQVNPLGWICYRVRTALQAATYTVPQVRARSVAHGNPLGWICYRVRTALQEANYTVLYHRYEQDL